MRPGNSKISTEFVNDIKIFKKIFNKQRAYNFFQEYFVVNYLNDIGIKCVPKIYKIDRNKKIIFYEFIDQKDISFQQKTILFEECTINNISKINNSKTPLKLFAKEALENTKENFEQISFRIYLHKKNKNFNSKYSNQIDKIDMALENLKKYFLEINSSSKMVFSQADVGIHNSISGKDNNIYLVDMEYAGLDSPVKLHMDYLIHPKNVSYTYNSFNWSNYFYQNFISKKDLKNINIFNVFFALKWSLIVLNEFLPENWNFRINADPSRFKKRDIILENQIIKSELYLEASKKLYDRVKPQLLFKESERFLLSKSY